jgi:hypothetical protein
MLSERDVELAHPDAFDFVWGNLPAAKRAEFNRHLSSCRHCQAVIDEYSELGQVIQSLPPHVDPPANLEDRTVAAMVAALAETRRAGPASQADPEDRTATRIHRIPEAHHPSAPETQPHPIPRLRPVPDADKGLASSPVDQPNPATTAVQPMVTRLPVWRRYPRRLATVVAVAAAIIVAAIVVPLSLAGRSPAVATVIIPLHATAAAKVFGVAGATARATAHQADQSWTFTLSVHGLKPLSGNDFYECWWVTRGHTRLLATGGSFVVGNSGSTTVTMTTGVDPTQQFRTMEITAESPSKNGASTGPVLLIS